MSSSNFLACCPGTFTVPVCWGFRPHCGQSWDQPGRLASKNTANSPRTRRNALFMTISFFCRFSEWSTAEGKRRRCGFPLTRLGKIAGGWGEMRDSAGPPLRKTCYFWIGQRSLFPSRNVDPLHQEPQREPQFRGEGGQHEPGKQPLTGEVRRQHLRQAEEDITPSADHQQDAEGPGQVNRSVDQMTEQDAAEAEEEQAGAVAEAVHAEGHVR